MKIEITRKRSVTDTASMGSMTGEDVTTGQRTYRIAELAFKI